ncbi:MAG: DMT family transporter [Desulfovibrionaceae bacterium]|nr:DMT family transporter [Desulfovibrionaceae bacterium]
MPLAALTFLCMTIFASNSIFCRAALVSCGMGPLQYTGVRCLSAAFILALLCCARVIRPEAPGGSAWREAWEQSTWTGALALFCYMVTFSLAYVGMPSAPGTLILNMCVQFCMVGWGMLHGLYPGRRQYLGFGIATAGLVALLSPGLTAPPLLGALLMAGSGFAWGAYSLCGRHASSAALATAGHFWRASVFGLASLLFALIYESAGVPMAFAFALAGGLASSLGYILWYAIVPRYTLVGASIIQLSVPVITAVLGALVLSEAITMRLGICSALILGGIYTALRARTR